MGEDPRGRGHRRRRLALTKQLSAPRRGLLVAAFVVYLVLLAWIILWKLQLPYVGGGALREIKLVPYIPAGGDGGSNPLEVAFNVILFIPFGVFMGVLARDWRWWKQLAVFAGTSIVFEVAQYVFAVGSSDISDVIDNAVGGMIGLGVLALARRGSRERADVIVGRVLVIATGVFLLMVGLFVLSPLQFHARRV